MSQVIAPDSIDFKKINMNGPWSKVDPPKDNPDFQPYVSVSSDDTPQFIIHTKTQRLTLNFKVGSQVFIDGSKFRYNKQSLNRLKVDDLASN